MIAELQPEMKFPPRGSRTNNYFVSRCDWPTDPTEPVLVRMEVIEDLGYKNCPEVLSGFPWILRLVRFDVVQFGGVYMREDGLWRTHRLKWQLDTFWWKARRKAYAVWWAIKTG